MGYLNKNKETLSISSLHERFQNIVFTLMRNQYGEK